MKAREIRNFGVTGHCGCGKTSLCDLMLFKAGAVDRLGSVDQKTSVSDYAPTEQEKRSSIYSTPLTCEYKDNSWFFIDPPGYNEFVGKMMCALHVVDSTILVINGVNGVETGTGRGWQRAVGLNLPRFIYVNRLEMEGSDFERVINELQEAYGKTVCVPLTYPIGKEADFSGIVNILTEENISPELEKYRQTLMDTIAEADETLMEKYLEGKELTTEEINRGLKIAICSGSLAPVFAGSSIKDIGVTELMDAINAFSPNPLERKNLIMRDESKMEISEEGPAVALAFRSQNDAFVGKLTFFRVFSGTFRAETDIFNITTGNKDRLGNLIVMNGKSQKIVNEAVPGMLFAAPKLKDANIGNTIASVAEVKELPKVNYPEPVFSYAISAVKSGEDDKIVSSLNKIIATDTTVIISRHKETHEFLLSGMGERHLQHVIKKLLRDYKLEINTAAPKIAYRETITGIGEGHFRHKKQSGGHGQFGEVYLKIEPAETFSFENAVVGGAIPKNFIPAVEKGVLESMVNGPLAGCKVERLKVTVYDGKYHDVDSSEMAFKIATRRAFKDAMSKAKPVLLEPIMKVAIHIPSIYMGDISGDLNQRRGRILGMSVEDGLQVVMAEVPQAEMSRYATELRSLTQGSGLFEMSFSRFEQVPTNIASDVIAKYQASQGEED
ncbi:MAG: elongation factor G [Victivallaceae bacterium]|nr:elongation factor G [Victivallaceae bacterium]MDD4180467.1 elongation factor G [Victivallaceae bacterium]